MDRRPARGAVSHFYSGGGPVYFTTESLPPVHAIYDMATGLYRCGFLSAENRALYVSREGLTVVPAPTPQARRTPAPA